MSFRLLFFTFINLFLIIINVNHDKEAKFSVKYVISQELLYVRIFIGSPPQIAFVKLDLIGQNPLISDMHYVPLNSNTYQIVRKEKIEVTNIIYDAQIIQDIVGVNQIFDRVNFTFLLVNTNYNRYTASLPLSYIIQKNEYSLIQQYKIQGLINRSVFYIEPKGELEGQFHIGDTDTIMNRKSLSQFIGKCKIAQYQSLWMCTLEKVEINAQIYEKKRFVVFRTDIRRNIVPSSFLHFLADTALKDLFQKEKCNLQKFPLRPGCEYITCTLEKEDKKFPNIDFYLDEYKLTINLDKFWHCVMKSCLLLFDSDEDSMFYFGYSFITQFITEYDNEKGEVTFYSLESKKIGNNYLRNNLSIRFVIYLFNSIYLICGSFYIWVIYIKLFNKKI